MGKGLRAVAEESEEKLERPPEDAECAKLQHDATERSLAALIGHCGLPKRMRDAEERSDEWYEKWPSSLRCVDQGRPWGSGMRFGAVGWDRAGRSLAYSLLRR